MTISVKEITNKEIVYQNHLKFNLLFKIDFYTSPKPKPNLASFSKKIYNTLGTDTKVKMQLTKKILRLHLTVFF